MSKACSLVVAVMAIAVSAPAQNVAQAARARAALQGSVAPAVSGRARQAGGIAGQASLSGVTAAIHALYADTGRTPGTSEGLSILLYRPPGLTTWKGPYISVPQGKPPFTDPWGNMYRYIDTTIRGGQPSFTIKSNGPDGLPDTADDLSVNG